MRERAGHLLHSLRDREADLGEGVPRRLGVALPGNKDKSLFILYILLYIITIILFFVIHGNRSW